MPISRRNFIRVSSAALIPLLLGITRPRGRKRKFPIQVDSNRAIGHLIFSSQQFPHKGLLDVDYAIVGGGVAGVSAAYKLRNENVMLFEAGPVLGGSSSCQEYKDVRFSQGAHYDLAYPQTYGQEVLNVLRELNLVDWNKSSKLYEFVDKNHVIPSEILERCWQAGELRGDVLGGGQEVDRFESWMSEYSMPMPTRLVGEEYRALNYLNFADLLQSKGYSQEFVRRVGYQMLDDWGGGCDEVSALAGIHYYSCRPYLEKDVELIAPVEGNYYFIQRMMSKIPYGNIRTSSVVSRIESKKDHSLLSVVDAKTNSIYAVRAKNVVYAGQKHVLKYVMPESYSLFQDNVYVPWVVINFVVKRGAIKSEIWQNDMIRTDRSFLGFANSSVLSSGEVTHEVLTAYFCFPSDFREGLIEVEKAPGSLVYKTIEYLSEYLKQDLESVVEKVFVKIMGHAMPVPKPGYLLRFDSVPVHSCVAFAGVDTGRLPVFYEACDSGVLAADTLKSMV